MVIKTLFAHLWTAILISLQSRLWNWLGWKNIIDCKNAMLIFYWLSSSQFEALPWGQVNICQQILNTQYLLSSVFPVAWYHGWSLWFDFPAIMAEAEWQHGLCGCFDHMDTCKSFNIDTIKFALMFPKMPCFFKLIANR